MDTVVAFSGGKDSTAMAYGLHGAGESFALLFTPTGNELPGLVAHIEKVRSDTQAELIVPKGPSLEGLIDLYQALPNHRQRWCTRQIKIQPCIAWLKKNPSKALCVGLRADEPDRTGLYGDYANYRYPLREWGFDIHKVRSYLAGLGVSVPARTDCALCPYQRLAEWRSLYKSHPDEYQRGIELERRTGHTFRSPHRDTWPASLEELAKEFDKGRPIRGVDGKPSEQTCRVCSL